MVVCDYNYVFDPRVSLKRFFTTKSDCVLLVDEAHNKIDRGRDMFSASFSLSLIDFCNLFSLFYFMQIKFIY